MLCMLILYHAEDEAVAQRAPEALQLRRPQITLKAPPLDRARVLRRRGRRRMVRIRLRTQPAQCGVYLVEISACLCVRSTSYTTPLRSASNNRPDRHQPLLQQELTRKKTWGLAERSFAHATMCMLVRRLMLQ